MEADFMKKKTDFSTKPYIRCLSCPHRKLRCDGPRTSAMDLARWCEFMRDMKEANGLTNAYIDEKSGVSIKTIERLMAQNCEQDILRETARRIEDAIIGSSNQYPCILAFEEQAPETTQKLNDALRDLERALVDNNDYRAMMDKIHESYNAEMQIIRDDAQRKIEFLRAEIEALRKDNANLWAENIRKSKIVDMFFEKQNAAPTEKEK
jgi:hypothetical protein